MIGPQTLLVLWRHLKQVSLAKVACTRASCTKSTSASVGICATEDLSASFSEFPQFLVEGPGGQHHRTALQDFLRLALSNNGRQGCTCAMAERTALRMFVEAINRRAVLAMHPRHVSETLCIVWPGSTATGQSNPDMECSQNACLRPNLWNPTGFQGPQNRLQNKDMILWGRRRENPLRGRKAARRARPRAHPWPRFHCQNNPK